MSTNKDYIVTIEYCSRELSARDKIRIKDMTNAISIDEATQEAPLAIDYDYHAILAVHNEKSDNKDYTKTVILDKAGNKYVTGSDSFRRAMEDIVDEMADAQEDDFSIEAYRKPSKNYKGKEFLTCSIL